MKIKNSFSKFLIFFLAFSLLAPGAPNSYSLANSQPSKSIGVSFTPNARLFEEPIYPNLIDFVFAKERQLIPNSRSEVRPSWRSLDPQGLLRKIEKYSSLENLSKQTLIEELLKSKLKVKIENQEREGTLSELLHFALTKEFGTTSFSNLLAYTIANNEYLEQLVYVRSGKMPAPASTPQDQTLIEKYASDSEVILQHLLRSHAFRKELNDQSQEAGWVNQPGSFLSRKIFFAIQKYKQIVKPLDQEIENISREIKIVGEPPVFQRILNFYKLRKRNEKLGKYQYIRRSLLDENKRFDEFLAKEWDDFFGRVRYSPLYGQNRLKFHSIRSTANGIEDLRGIGTPNDPKLIGNLSEKMINDKGETISSVLKEARTKEGIGAIVFKKNFPFGIYSGTENILVLYSEIGLKSFFNQFNSEHQKTNGELLKEAGIPIKTPEDFVIALHTFFFNGVPEYYIIGTAFNRGLWPELKKAREADAESEKELFGKVMETLSNRSEMRFQEKMKRLDKSAGRTSKVIFVDGGIYRGKKFSRDLVTELAVLAQDQKITVFIYNSKNYENSFLIQELKTFSLSNIKIMNSSLLEAKRKYFGSNKDLIIYSDNKATIETNDGERSFNLRGAPGSASYALEYWDNIKLKRSVPGIEIDGQTAVVSEQVASSFFDFSSLQVAVAFSRSA